MKILERILFAFLAVYFTFFAGVQFFTTSTPLYNVLESVLLAALGYVWLWDSFAPIAPRYVVTLAAVVFTYLAVVPEYNLATAAFGAVAGLNIVAAYVFWTEASAEQRSKDRLAAELREHPPTDPADAQWAREWLADYDSKK